MVLLQHERSKTLGQPEQTLQAEPVGCHLHVPDGGGIVRDDRIDLLAHKEELLARTEDLVIAREYNDGSDWESVWVCLRVWV
jgi:hypothetical protein